MASSSDDRLRAVRLLIRVADGAFAGRLLDGEPSPGVRARVLGVLRWQRALDHRLTPFLKRPLGGLDPEVREILRLGVFEAVHLGVPAPVATDGMVRLTRRTGRSSAAGMVNAVLRRAVAGDRDDAPPAVRWSHPEWLWKRWRASFGGDGAEAAMAAAQEPAPPWVWFPDDGERAELEWVGVILQAHPWCPDCWTAVEGRGELMSAVACGRAVVQDPSSQLVARLAAALAGGRGRAVDLCAAPGGKTALLRRLGGWTTLVACDRNPGKAVRLGRRLGAVPVAAADAAAPALRARAWDLAVLDAPCTGTGTLRRHPELKWRLDPEAVVEAASRQRPLVKAALDLLAPRGVLLYATCSVEPEENEAHFENLPVDIERIELESLLPAGLPHVATDAGGVRIPPHEHGDGFTIHAVRKRG